MKQTQPAQNDFPFLTDEYHIYRVFEDNQISDVDVGWSKFVFELHADLKHSNQEVDGLTEFDEKKIKLEMSLPDSEARETIMHEIIHVLLEGVGLDERLYDGKFIKTTNENLANTLAKQFRLLDNLNPGLLSLLYPNVQTTFN